MFRSFLHDHLQGGPPLCFVPLLFLPLICVRWVRIITQYEAACVYHLCVFGVLVCWWSACEHVSGIHMPIIRSLSTAVAASGLPLKRGGSSFVGRGRSDRHDHDQQYCYHHVPTVNQRWLLQLIRSWWWAWGCPKHVELYLNDRQ